METYDEQLPEHLAYLDDPSWLQNRIGAKPFHRDPLPGSNFQQHLAEARARYADQPDNILIKDIIAGWGKHWTTKPFNAQDYDALLESYGITDNDPGTDADWQAIESYAFDDDPHYESTPTAEDLKGLSELDAIAQCEEVARHNWIEAKCAGDTVKLAQYRSLIKQYAEDMFRAMQKDNPDFEFMPYGFEILANGALAGILDAKGDEATRRIIADNPLYLEDITRDEAGVPHLTLSYIDKRTRREELFLLPMRSLKSLADFKAGLLDGYYSEFREKYLPQLLTYVLGCVNVFKAKKSAGTTYTKNGFNRTKQGFVLGDSIITKDGEESVTSTLSGQMLKGFRAKGDWDASVTELFAGPEYWIHRFIIAYMLGAPLLEFMDPAAKPTNVSFVGDSGGGKTTAAEFGASQYGDPAEMTAAHKSTQNGLYKKAEDLNNLPMIINEANKISPKTIDMTMLDFGNGYARDALKQDGTPRPRGSWRLPVVLTANGHITTMAELQEASQRRILELTLAEGFKFPSKAAAKVHAHIQSNHGKAGRVFLSYILNHREEVQRRLTEAVDSIYQRGVDREARYHAWAIAIAQVAGQIGRQLGLYKFNIEDAIDNAIAAAKAQAARTQTATQKVDGLINDYILDNQSSLMTYSPNTGFGADDNRYIRDVVGRVNLDPDNRLQPASIALARSLFVAWASEAPRSVDDRQIAQWQKSKGITAKLVKLTPKAAKADWCLIIPVEEKD